MRLDISAQGVFPIAVKPFLPDSRLDEVSIDRLTDFYRKVRATGLTILGIMGEAPKLEPEESLQIVSLVCARANVPVIVGVSVPGLAAMRALARNAMDRGAAGVMIAPPPALRTDDQIVGYHAQAIEAIGDDIPFVIQDYPLTLTVVMTPKVIRTIVQDHPSCVMLKHQDWPGLEKISALRGFQSDGSMRPISILTGNGGLFLDFEMERGVDGAMTGYAFPEMLVDVSECRKPAIGMPRSTCSTPIRRWCVTSSRQRLAVRKYVLQKRAEVDYLLSRIARHDRRAAV